MTHEVLARRYRDILLLVPLLLLSLSSPMLAQVDVSAQLQGTVVDPSGAVVAGARLLATNQQTAVQFSAVSDVRGDYLFRSLPPGTYTISCEMAGFKRYAASNIVIQSQKVFTLYVAVEVGATTQTVNVTAQAQMVDTVTPTLQTSFQEQIMTALPLIGRDARESMEVLVPGAVAAGMGPSSNVPVTSFNGIASNVNNYRVDGTDATDYNNGVSTPMPQIENLAEFSVVSSAPDTSYGQAAGGQISAVLKTGTNQLHGQAWAYLQNGAWNANSWSSNWQGVAKPAFNQQWYGGNVGGPVFIPHLYNGKDKTFFFASFERTSTSKQTVSSGATITQAEREGNFANSPDGAPDVPGTNTPIPNAAIGPGTAYPFATWGTTLTTRTDIMPNPTSGLDTFTWSPPFTETIKDELVKIDENISPKHRLFGSMWLTQDGSNSPDMDFSFGFGGWASHYPNKNMEFTRASNTQQWTLNDTYTISPNVLNNFILGVSRYSFGFTNTASNNPLFGDAEMGVKAVGDTGSPDIDEVTTPRGFGMGIYQGYYNTISQPHYYFTDNMVISHGRNTLKMGFEFRNFRSIFLQGWNSGLIVGFGDGNQSLGGTGNGIADMMLGLAASMSENSRENVNLLYPSRESYFQDSIKLSRRLTVMLGLRWQPHLGVRESEGYMMAFRPGQTSTLFPLAPTGVVGLGDRGISGSTYLDRWADLGPRASIAWDIFGNGKAAIRAGYGLMTDYQYMVAFNQYGTSFPYGLSWNVGTNSLANLANPYAQYQASTGSTPFPFQEPGPHSPGDATLPFPEPFNMLDMNKNYNSSQIHQWNATFEYQPVQTLLLSVGYVATRGTHLPDAHDENWPVFVPGASYDTTASINSRRPYFSDGELQTILTSFSDWNSMYNSLQFAFRKRTSRGLTFFGNYTLSSLAQEQNGPRYFGDMALDYYSPGIMHNFALAFAYDLPIPTGQSRLGKALIGGWTFGGAVVASSGQYGNIGDENCAQFDYGSASCVANFVGGTPYSSSKGQPLVLNNQMVGVNWLDPTKFIRGDDVLVSGVPTVSSSVGTRLFLGNATTGVFKGPASFMPNASLSKTFRITESLKLNWRVEATNALNHTVLTMPGNTTVNGNPQFGDITSAMNPRMVQMSGHFIF